MHRERKKDIAIISVAGMITIPIAYSLLGGLGLLLFLMITLITFGFLPPEELYERKDVLLA